MALQHIKTDLLWPKNNQYITTCIACFNIDKKIYIKKNFWYYYDALKILEIFKRTHFATRIRRLYSSEFFIYAFFFSLYNFELYNGWFNFISYVWETLYKPFFFVVFFFLSIWLTLNCNLYILTSQVICGNNMFLNTWFNIMNEKIQYVQKLYRFRVRYIFFLFIIFLRRRNLLLHARNW